MDKIKLKQSGVIKICIEDENGIDTGNYLEFDLEDIELPIRVQQCSENHKKNLDHLRGQFIIINKREDKKGKKLLSTNEEAKIKAMQEFYKKEIEALDLFLGEGGTAKILNGRKPYMSMFDDINEYLEPLLPIFEEKANNISEAIIKKYSKKDEGILE